jgi:hypothetical protein
VNYDVFFKEVLGSLLGAGLGLSYVFVMRQIPTIFNYYAWLRRTRKADKEAERETCPCSIHRLQ